MSGRPELDLALALLREVVAGPGSPERLAFTPGALDKIDWHAFVRLTSAHFVLPAIARPLERLAERAQVPADLLAFVCDLRSANEARNRGMGEALAEITRTLSDLGIAAIVLKGGALLAEEAGRSAGWRFMNDLDLLVRPEQLETAVAAVEALGYVPEHRNFDPVDEAHYPPLIAPGARFCIEIHTRLFGLGAYGIDVERLRADAVDVTIPGTRVLVPAPIDRVAHAIAHAQLHNRHYAARRVVLKDVLDLAMFPSSAKSDYLDPARGRISANRIERCAAEALLAVGQRLLPRSSEHAFALSAEAERWADRAIARLSWPEHRTLAATPGDLARIEVSRFLREPGHLKRRLQLAMSTRRTAGAVDRFAWKQRQRLWS